MAADASQHQPSADEASNTSPKHSPATLAAPKDKGDVKVIEDIKAQGAAIPSSTSSPAADSSSPAADSSSAASVKTPNAPIKSASVTSTIIKDASQSHPSISRPSATYARSGVAPYNIAAGKGPVAAKPVGQLESLRTQPPAASITVPSSNYTRTNGALLPRPAVPPQVSSSPSNTSKLPQVPKPGVKAIATQPSSASLPSSAHPGSAVARPTSSTTYNARGTTHLNKLGGNNAPSIVAKPFVLPPTTVSQRTLEIQARAAAAGSQMGANMTAQQAQLRLQQQQQAQRLAAAPPTRPSTSVPAVSTVMNAPVRTTQNTAPGLLENEKDTKDEAESERTRLENRERKKRWREANEDRNKDNDLRCRVNKRAHKLFGKESSKMKELWIEEEFNKRKSKRQEKEGKAPDNHVITENAEVVNLNSFEMTNVIIATLLEYVNGPVAAATAPRDDPELVAMFRKVKEEPNTIKLLLCGNYTASLRTDSVKAQPSLSDQNAQEGDQPARNYDSASQHISDTVHKQEPSSQHKSGRDVVIADVEEEEGMDIDLEDDEMPDADVTSTGDTPIIQTSDRDTKSVALESPATASTEDQVPSDKIDKASYHMPTEHAIPLATVTTFEPQMAASLSSELFRLGARHLNRASSPATSTGGAIASQVYTSVNRLNHLSASSPQPTGQASSAKSTSNQTIVARTPQAIAQQFARTGTIAPSGLPSASNKVGLLSTPLRTTTLQAQGTNASPISHTDVWTSGQRPEASAAFKTNIKVTYGPAGQQTTSTGVPIAKPRDSPVTSLPVATVKSVQVNPSTPSPLKVDKMPGASS